MNRLLLAIYRWLDLLQRKFWFKIAATVLAVGGCCGYFGVLLVKTYSLTSQRYALVQALSNQNLQKHDELAESLHDRGEVFVNGHMYGGPALKNPAVPWFDKDG